MSSSSSGARHAGGAGPPHAHGGAGAVEPAGHKRRRVAAARHGDALDVYVLRERPRNSLIMAVSLRRLRCSLKCLRVAFMVTIFFLAPNFLTSSRRPRNLFVSANNQDGGRCFTGDRGAKKGAVKGLDASSSSSSAAAGAASHKSASGAASSVGSTSKAKSSSSSRSELAARGVSVGGTNTA